MAQTLPFPEESIGEQLQYILSDVLGIMPNHLDDILTSSLLELGADELDIGEIVLEIGITFEKKIPEGLITQDTTIQQLIELVK